MNVAGGINGAIGCNACCYTYLCTKNAKKNVPANGKAIFQKKYPTATAIKWVKEGEKYEASFDLNKTGNSVLMDMQGNIIKTEVEIELNQMPKGVLDNVKHNMRVRKQRKEQKLQMQREQ